MNPNSPYVSPLRYPGGKRKLANFVKLICLKNALLDGDYVEPYAGGASVALHLLFEDYARRIFINDIDPAIHAFWYCVLNKTDELCKKIEQTEITLDEWKKQKAIQDSRRHNLFEVGFSTFFLNRTNRSGVISGGVIGGKEQSGKWSLDARFNKAELIDRIQKIGRHRQRIHLSNLDALVMLKSVKTKLGSKCLIYLDPPYYIKGSQALYSNFYEPADHKAVSRYLRTLKKYWIVSYDDVREVRALYSEFPSISYKLSYSAQGRYRGAEVIFANPRLRMPDTVDPSRVSSKLVHQSLFPQILQV